MIADGYLEFLQNSLQVLLYDTLALSHTIYRKNVLDDGVQELHKAGRISRASVGP